MRKIDYHSRGIRKGHALLIGLALMLVLGMIYYFMRMHGSVYEIGVGKSDIYPPWRQWHRMDIRYLKEQPGPPTEGQPQLTEPLIMAVEAFNGDQKGGKLEMVLQPDGTIEGQWTGAFDISEDVDYQIMGSQFKGNIDPEQLYEDEQWEDPSMLFFMTRGGFVILETNDGNGQVRNLNGYIYVRGWLDTESGISGELIITSDERNFRRFTWKGKATPDAMTLFSL